MVVAQLVGAEAPKFSIRRRGQQEAGNRFRLRPSCGWTTARLPLCWGPDADTANRRRHPHYILERHNPLEESSGGIYEECEQLAGAEADEILKRLQTAPAVKMLPHVDNPFVMEAARRALQRAGYDLTL